MTLATAIMMLAILAPVQPFKFSRPAQAPVLEALPPPESMLVPAPQSARYLALAPAPTPLAAAQAPIYYTQPQAQIVQSSISTNELDKSGIKGGLPSNTPLKEIATQQTKTTLIETPRLIQTTTALRAAPLLQQATYLPAPSPITYLLLRPVSYAPAPLQYRYLERLPAPAPLPLAPIQQQVYHQHQELRAPALPLQAEPLPVFQQLAFVRDYEEPSVLTEGKLSKLKSSLHQALAKLSAAHVEDQPPIALLPAQPVLTPSKTSSSIAHDQQQQQQHETITQQQETIRDIEPEHHQQQQHIEQNEVKSEQKDISVPPAVKSGDWNSQRNHIPGHQQQQDDSGFSKSS